MNQNRRLCLTRRIASGVAACSLGVFLAAGAPVQVLAASPQFAYSTEKWASLQDDKLEFDEIADRIHEYNSTVEKNRIEYKDYQGKDSNEIAQEYYDAADEIESSIEYPDSDDANYGSALAAAQRSEASATQMREQGDNNVDDANVKAWGYTQTEKSLVQQAQNLMIQYWNAQENLKSVQNQVSKAEKDYETANLKLSSGSATQTDVLDAKETLLKAQASITTAESNIASTKESLCQMLGWKYGASVEICALPDPQEQMSASINLEEDIAKAQENNYQLKILARQVNNAMTSTLKEQYQTTLTSGKEAVKSNVQSAYQNLKGVFAYSAEEDTPAAGYPDQVPQEVKEDRRDEIMELQQEIAFEKAEDMKGRVLEVMIEGKVADENAFVGRTYKDAPNVDGLSMRMFR